MQVAMRSPIPASPAKVNGFPPICLPRRAISARPRVIREAFELSPNPSPSPMPAATAMTFLKAPPSSTPTTSGFTYTRKYGTENNRWSLSARFSSTHATTDADGCRLTISLARFGPDTAATRSSVRSPDSISTSLIRLSESCSMPFTSETTEASRCRSGATSSNTVRNAWEGTAITTTSAPDTASSMSWVAVSPSGKRTPPR